MTSQFASNIEPDREPRYPQFDTSIWTPRRNEIRLWLARYAPSLADAYEAGITLLGSQDFPGRATLICFAMRDLGNVLPRARGTSTTTDDNGGDGSYRKAKALLTAIGALGDAASPEESEKLVVELHKCLRWFSDRHHFSHEIRSVPTEDELGAHIERFEKILFAFTHTFFGTVSALDNLIAMRNASGKPPTSAEVDAVHEMLIFPVFAKYVFDHIHNPMWIAPLQARHAFENPPSLEVREDGQVRAEIWPQSRYLARMAEHAPTEVAEIFGGIDTDNWTIVRDMIEAAKAMPPQHAASLASKIGEMVSSMKLNYLLDDVAEIAAALAEGDHADEALVLVQSAFRRDKTDTSRRADDYAFFKGLHHIAMPALVRVKPNETIEMLIALLRQAIDAQEHRTSDDDFSYVWRKTIEESEANDDFDFAAKLVPCVRDAFEIAFRADRIPLEDALALLDNETYSIFRRLRLHLLAGFGDRAPDLARETILRRGLISEHPCRHEYGRVVRKWFHLLAADEQQKWCEWVEQDARGTASNVYSDEESEKRRKSHAYWTLQKYHWVYGHLSDELRKWYDRTYEELEQPDLADVRTSKSFDMAAFESAFGVEELSAMGFDQAVLAVAKWRPDPERSRFDGPSVEGLVNTFQQYVSSNPEAHSAQATLLKGQPAPFVRTFLRAMEDAVKEGREIDLGAILDLCAWVVQRPVDEDTVPWSEERGLIEHDWQWCRDSVSELIRVVCESRDENKRPRWAVEFRDAIWRVLPSLVDSPAKSYVFADDEQKDPRVTDWPMLALNSPRGKAMLAVFAYADWIFDHEVADREGGKALPGGCGRMPEVRTLLEEVIIQKGGDFMVHAAVGWKLGLLYWIDRGWLERHIGQVVDLKAIERDRDRAYGWAAWNTFLFAHRPHRELYRMLQDQFSYAVDQAMNVIPPDRAMNNPLSRLAQHLIVLYGRGDLGETAEEAWKRDNGIIERLVTQTHVSVRSYAIEFVGRSLNEEEHDLPSDVLERFVGLWERYWNAVGENDAKANPNSRTFGYWFASGVFDDKWSLEQLEKFVASAPMADPDHMIMERLVAICEADLVCSVRIVGMLVDGDAMNWRIHSWQKEARTVLEQAMKAGGEARETAEQVIDRLGRRGYLDFGDLLRTESAG